MKNKVFKSTVLLVAAMQLLVISCTKKLDTSDSNATNGDAVYSSASGYRQSIAKVYSAFALTGGSGAGSSDIAGIDAGTSDFFRLFWKTQELSTDEAVVAWSDPGIQDFHLMNWAPSNVMLTGLYYRSLFQITLANDFIRQSSDAKLAERGISGTDAETIRMYKAEARFLRAYQYWVLMDLFGNPPFTTDADVIGANLPKQIGTPALFNYIESELKTIESAMAAAKTNEYGRADRAAVQALLARLYLNAKTYTGTAKNAEAVIYSKKVIDAGYALISDYTMLMRADNNTNTSENIFTINYDGKRTQTYGGTTFLTHAPVGGSMPAGDYGINGGWYGLRTTSNIINLYVDLTFNSDTRAQFYRNGQNLDINDLSKFTDGYAVSKYKNVTKSGAAGSDPTFCDIDMPIFRLGEMYLIYAEATGRGGGGDAALALSYINKLRERAYSGTTGGNVTASDIDFGLHPTFYLEERARELFWEGFRRTDLIRFGLFTSGSYTWPWKGGAKTGAGVASYRALYPLPEKDLAVNPYLKQNAGY